LWPWNCSWGPFMVLFQLILPSAFLSTLVIFCHTLFLISCFIICCFQATNFWFCFFFLSIMLLVSSLIVTSQYMMQHYLVLLSALFLFNLDLPSLLYIHFLLQNSSNAAFYELHEFWQDVCSCLCSLNFYFSHKGPLGRVLCRIL
jgi:hypothetical protein